MICPTCRGRQFIPDGEADDDDLVRMRPCPDCIGRIASCCDAAGARAAAYRDDTFPERLCDACGALYRGPAVYCSLQCALEAA